MASQAYMSNRRKYSRPQAMIWSNNPPQILSDQYVPLGYEVGTSVSASTALANDFIILTDDNRQPLSFKTNRIESRKRMVNGQMRSYHIADKLNISTSWDMIPSRSFSSIPNFDPATSLSSLRTEGTREFVSEQNGIKKYNTLMSEQFTTDGGAGGIEMLEWYETHRGSFWVYLSYDKYNAFDPEDEFRYRRLGQYAQAIKMYIASFDYDVVKRGNAGHDLWNIQVTLEEE